MFGFTDHDRPLTFDGTTFEPESGFTASEIRAGSDLSIDAQEAEGVLTSKTITETDILDGRWDNAIVEIWRVNWADTTSRALLRRGAIGQVRRGRRHFVAEMRSLAHVLGQTLGRTFQASCDAALGDARCGVDLNGPAFKATGTVVSLSGDRGFAVSGLLRGVWRDVVGPEPMPVPPYSRDWGEAGPVEVLAEAARARLPSMWVF